MLLQTLPFFNNVWCSNSTLIPRFMKGIFYKSPPKIKYSFTWDVSVVLKYLSTLFPLESLSLKLLTFKLTALIALAAAPRAQTIVSLDLDFMTIAEKCIMFDFPCLLKNSRRGHQFSLKLEHFDNESLCVMHTLLHYVKVTSSSRLSKKLFISYVTYKAVCTSTIARWLRTVLDLAGIDIGVFKAHSFRGASVSAAYNKGCSLKRVLETADWSSDKNFRKYYYRQSVSKEVTFAEAVLS